MDNAPKLPTIKLKFSLAPLQQPATSSAPATPTPTAARKGKGKAPTHDAPAQSTPTEGNKPNQASNAGPSSLRITLPSTGRSHLPVAEQSTPTPAPPAVVATPKPSTRPQSLSLKTASAKKSEKASVSSKKRGRGRPPSAIPNRLLSASASSTPSRHTAPPPETPVHHDINTKEESPDPLSLPHSPSANASEAGTPSQQDVELTARGTPRRNTKWARLKKPLKDWAQKIMFELRKKDDYALFEEPVDLDAFPDYLSVIGGEDKMMDMGTMQAKVDNDEYRSIDQLEADLRTLVTAAQTFNPAGTVPHKSATIILAHGLKHIDRSRPLVITPPNSPRQSATPARAQSVLSTREVTATLEDRQARYNVLPHQYIPEEMLTYPPNSAEARAVGWNLNGGKRTYNKRISRAREKFSGKWRSWKVDGSRDIAEAEEIDSLFDPWRVKPGQEWGRVTDWQGLRQQQNWWELEMAQPPPGSAAQQAPFPFDPGHPRIDKVPRRSLAPYDFGPYPSITSEIGYIRSRLPPEITLRSDEDILTEHLRPPFPRPKKGEAPAPPNLVNIYDNPLRRTASDWVREMGTGDGVGEAYLASIDTFIKGAMRSGEKNGDSSTSGGVERKPIDAGERLPLDEYVYKNYHLGLINSTTRSTIHETLSQLSIPPASRPPHLLELAKAAYSRLALRALTSPSNPMDIRSLLLDESDFMYQGVGGKSGVNVGLQWMGNELTKLFERQSKSLRLKDGEEIGDGIVENGLDLIGKRKREEEGAETEAKKIKIETGSAASTPLSTAPPSPKLELPADEPTAQSAPAQKDAGPLLPGDITQEEIKRVRLELVALSKFYPLPALKKMSKEEAARLLPQNVRGLMCRP